MAEKDYIDREAAKKKHGDICRESNICYCSNSCADLKIFDSIPAADVRPVKWIPVTERLPEDRVPVLATYIGFCTGEKSSDLLAVRFEGMWCYWDGDPCSYDESKVKITHWMPLPEPPKEADDG